MQNANSHRNREVLCGRQEGKAGHGRPTSGAGPQGQGQVGSGNRRPRGTAPVRRCETLVGTCRLQRVEELAVQGQDPHREPWVCAAPSSVAVRVGKHPGDTAGRRPSLVDSRKNAVGHPHL